MAESVPLDGPPELLPGPTAWHWVRRATVSFALGAVCGVFALVGLALPAPLHDVVLFGALGASCPLAVVAIHAGIKQMGVEREERDAGYTTLYGRQYRRRWHLDPKTGAVIRRPDSMSQSR